MEIHFQQPEQKCPIPLPLHKMSKFKGRNRGNSNNSKYVGVRQRPSGRWVAEIKDTTQKIRMWLGTFETAEEAARAYDEAACLLRGTNTRTNFVTHHVSHDSPLASRIKNLLNKRKSAKLPNDSLTNMSTTTTTNSSNSTNSCSPTRSVSVDSSSVDSIISFDEKAQDGRLFDDAYKPDLSNCSSEAFEMRKGCHSDNQSNLSSWGWGLRLVQDFDHRTFAFCTTRDHQLLDLPIIDAGCSLPETADQMEFSEFERMKVERQISASLYAMNGVQEYMETVCDPIEALWELPSLCSL